MGVKTGVKKGMESVTVIVGSRMGVESGVKMDVDMWWCCAHTVAAVFV